MRAGDNFVQTICGICPQNCGIRVYVKDGTIQGIEPDEENPAGAGMLCAKARAYPELVYASDRLLYPLKRTEAGFERISWDEALDAIAGKLLEIKDRYGPESIVLYSSAPFTEETRDGFIQLLASLGSPNYTRPGHLCSVPRRLGLSLVYGGRGFARTSPDFENTNCAILWGANPATSMRLSEWLAGNSERAIAHLKDRGAKLIVIDPIHTDMATIADEWVQINPGTDCALGLAMLNVIISEELYDKEFVTNWTVGFEQLADHVRQFPPEWAEGITWVPANKIKEIARTYATTKPALIRDGNGLDQHPNVVDTVRTIAILTAITGNLDVAGGNVFFPLPPVSTYPTVASEVKRLGSDSHPLFGMAPFSSVIDALITGQPYQPKALMVFNANPLLISADEKKVRKALQTLDFLVVFDFFPSATGQLADYILPEASDLERFGYRFYFSPQGGLVAFRKKVIEPLGEARPVFEVEYELARRMGYEESFPWKTTEEWIDYRLKPTGVSVEQLRERVFMYVTPPLEYRKYLTQGFDTPSGKAELYSEKVKRYGYEPMPVYRQPISLTEKYPLVGTSRRYASYVHTRLRNIAMLRELHPQPLLRIHPDDALKREIKEGDEVVVESPEGKITIRATLSDEVRVGLVTVDYGWGNPQDGGPNINVLTTDRERCPFSGATSNRRFACQVVKA